MPLQTVVDCSGKRYCLHVAKPISSSVPDVVPSLSCNFVATQLCNLCREVQQYFCNFHFVQHRKPKKCQIAKYVANKADTIDFVFLDEI